PISPRGNETGRRRYMIGGDDDGGSGAGSGDGSGSGGVSASVDLDRPPGNQPARRSARLSAVSSAAIVDPRSGSVSPRQVRRVQSQTPSSPFARSPPMGPAAETPAASNIQAMLRRLAAANANPNSG